MGEDERGPGVGDLFGLDVHGGCNEREVEKSSSSSSSGGGGGGGGGGERES